MSRRHLHPRRRVGRAPRPAVRQANARLAQIVRRHGWMIQYVGGGNCSIPSCRCDAGDDRGPPFAYTVGLYGLGHPELLVFSLSERLAAGLLNAVGEMVRRGDRLHPGHLLQIDGWGRRIVCEEVPDPGDIVLAANGYYRTRTGPSVPVLQLTYDDDNGIFPWEEGYTGDEQPRPGTFRA